MVSLSGSAIRYVGHRNKITKHPSHVKTSTVDPRQKAPSFHSGEDSILYPVTNHVTIKLFDRESCIMLPSKRSLTCAVNERSGGLSSTIDDLVDMSRRNLPWIFNLEYCRHTPRTFEFSYH